ncbi:MAG: Glu/Leu/Phe/Val dehydrogenase dimerization domain-containing protein [Acidimicrobiales bacterium]
MTLTKLKTVPAWFITDLDGVPSFGPVRLGPKVLQSTAKQYARAETYKLALVNEKLSGGAGGIKVDLNEREDTVKGFAEELLAISQQNVFHPDPAWGVDENDFSMLRTNDPRNPLAWSAGAEETLIAAGAIALPSSVLANLSGTRLTLGDLSPVHLALAQSWIEAGGMVVGLEFRGNAHSADEGIELSELSAIADGGVDLNASKGDARLIESELFVPAGGRATITHETEATIGARHVLGLSDLSITPRGLATLTRREVSVLPDFLATSAVTHAAHGSATSLEEAVTAATSHISAITQQAGADPDGPFLGTCRLAESFLSTWQPTLPFGRPLP